MEGVDGARPICITQQLVNVTPPGFFGIVTHCGLKCCQDGREKWGGWRRKAQLIQIISVLPKMVATETRRKDVTLTLTIPVSSSLILSNCSEVYQYISINLGREFGFWLIPARFCSAGRSRFVLEPQSNLIGSSFTPNGRSSSWTFDSSSSGKTCLDVRRSLLIFSPQSLCF